MAPTQMIFLLLGILSQTVKCERYYRPFDFLRFDKVKVELDANIKLGASPNTLEHSGDWVTVSWSGVSSPSVEDWIGVYTPPTNGNSIDPKHHAPVKFQYCNQSLTHFKIGSGSLKFRLVNTRAPYIFGFLRNGFTDPSLAATSNTVEFTNPNEPLQGHLALTKDPTEMMLMWVTKDADKPQVKWSPVLAPVIRKKDASTTTYSAEDMCGPPATTVGYIDPGLLHYVIMNGLSPGMKYVYSFGDDKYGWSKQYTFTVPQQSGSDVTTKIIAYGDMGEAQSDDSKQPVYSQPQSLNTTRCIQKELNDTDMVLHVGDISYAIGYGAIWDEFFDLIQPVATRVPYMVCIGNHESDYPHSHSYFSGTDSGGECDIPYLKRFPMPRPTPYMDCYAYDVGNVHIIVMSTEHDFTKGSSQYHHIQDLLLNVNRTQTPWLIFVGHRPMYCDNVDYHDPSGVQTVGRLLRDNLEPLLMESKVNLALWGHHHSYQRTCPVYKEKCTKGAPIHAVIGMAGHILSKDTNPTKPDWIEYVDVEHFGYTRITTTSSTLVFEYVRDDDEKVHDSVVLQKCSDDYCYL